MLISGASVVLNLVEARERLRGATLCLPINPSRWDSPTFLVGRRGHPHGTWLSGHRTDVPLVVEACRRSASVEIVNAVTLWNFGIPRPVVCLISLSIIRVVVLCHVSNLVVLFVIKLAELVDARPSSKA